MVDFYSQMQARSGGFASQAELGALRDSKVVIGGAGGDGGLLAVELVRMGVGAISLADPDTFDVENLNRQACSTYKTVGCNKAEVVGEYLLEINPHLQLDIFNEGVHPDNIDKFVDGASLVIDETEYTMPQIGTMIARKAREHEVVDMTALNIGFGAVVTAFKPGGKTFESMMGFADNMPLDEVAEQEVKIARMTPYLPKYGSLAVLQTVESGEKSAPSVAPGVALAASLGSTQAFLHLTRKVANNRPKPVIYSHFQVMDTMSLTAKTIKHPQASFYTHLGKAMFRDLVLRCNPNVEY